MKTFTNKKLLLYFLASLIILAILIGGLGVPVLRSVLVHNSLLHDFSINLFSLPLPVGDKIKGKYSRVGLLSGQGNHCDYFTAQLVVSSLKEEEIFQFYSDKYIPSINNTHSVEVRLHVVSDSIIKEEWFPIYNFNIESEFDLNFDNLFNKTLYLIYAFDPGNEPELDFRCR